MLATLGVYQVRNLMLSRLEFASYHVVLFFISGILMSIVIGSSFLFDFLQWFKISENIGWIIVLSFWTCGSGFFTVAISRGMGAFSLDVWDEAQAHGASFVLLLGHLGPLGAAYLFNLMSSQSGSSSGLFFLPFIAWAVVLYLTGIIMANIRIKRVLDED
ncbi:hypothetical protein [Janthinobacterium sp. B9-8]|uniref:hypothetical protein n=1 Tax=Janthinobacterium sp. B9-8 TaxID=1236179 RepID=UPI00061D0EC1|nr:hypothetical protein [Janthinobacterium sp. B9-8]AMC36492.1 hypothetical protein VN23_18820 [Janthinobacterium sp. B9-8]